MPKRIPKAKIACLDFRLQKAKMHLGVQVLVEDPAKLDAIGSGEGADEGVLRVGGVICQGRARMFVMVPYPSLPSLPLQ